MFNIFTEKPFKLKVCPRKLSSKKSTFHKNNINKNLNMKVHDDLKPFKCNFCLNSYSSMSSLKEHMKIHGDLKVFTCDVCFMDFFEESSLAKHYKTHKKDKTFACPICNKTFDKKTSLVQHQLVHSDTKYFKCSCCTEPRFFKTQSGLSYHIASHYEPKFCCSLCDYKSCAKHNLTRHEKTHAKT